MKYILFYLLLAGVIALGVISGAWSISSGQIQPFTVPLLIFNSFGVGWCCAWITMHILRILASRKA